MSKITGNALSTSTGTSPIDYEGGGGYRQPEGDVITITGDPGTGASTAETWSHELALENLKNEQAKFAFSQAQFAYEQGQNVLAAQRAAEQMAITQGQYGLQQQAAQQAAALAPLQQQAAQLGNQQSQLDIAKKQYDYDQLMAQKAAAERAYANQAPMFAEIAKQNAQVVGGAYRPSQVGVGPGSLSLGMF